MEKLPLGVFHVMIKYFFHTALSSVFSISAVCAPSVLKHSSSAPNGKRQCDEVSLQDDLRLQLQYALYHQSKTTKLMFPTSKRSNGVFFPALLGTGASRLKPNLPTLPFFQGLEFLIHKLWPVGQSDVRPSFP